MKRIVSLVVVVLLLVNCTYTLPHYHEIERKNLIVISERVGDEIDAEEREQFNLFPGVTDFNSATFYGIVEGGYKVEIMAADKIFAAVNRDSQAVEILRYYIDSYEEVQGSPEAFERKWKIIDYDTLGQPITSNELKSVRRNTSSFGCATASLLMGLIPNALFSLGVVGGLEIKVMNESEFPRPALALISLILISFGTAAIGATIGRRLDDDTALYAIKEARLPRELD